MKHFTLSLITCCMTILSFAQVGPINGASSVCSSFTITLTDATPGGVWSSSNNAVATIGSATGTVTGIGGGTTTITYTVGASRATKVITVNNLPAVITGATPICASLTVTLRDASSGGTWSSSNTAVGSVSTVGLVKGISAGSTTITYQLSTGCYRTTAVTVNPLPAAITGAGGVCKGSTITVSDATTGGTWTSSNTNCTVGANTGIVTGANIGSSVITYKITATGCTATAGVTVTALPSVIFGTFSICRGTTTTLNDGTTGGKWSSSNTAVATIGSTTGLVTGITANTCTISYTVGNGCAVTKTMSVTAPPDIVGSTRVCKNATTTLTNPASGGVWTSTSTAIATIGSTTGIVTGKTPGVATISYTKAGCAATLSMIVPDTAKAITGTNHVCEGATTTLADPTLYGFWTSSNTSLATVGSTGIVNGVTAGSPTITYSTGCGTAKTMAFTVNVQPSAISGSSTVCTSSTTTLGNTVSGGVWTSGSNTIATIGSSTGIATGVAAGTTTITYTLGNCSSTKTMTVDLLLTPGSITGTPVVCATATTTLANAGHTGVWNSTNPSVASVGSSTGIVSGITAGTATISFVQSNKCMTTNTTTLVTVNPLPNAGTVTGTNHVCEASTTTLNNTATSGVWSSSNTSAATVGSTGIVTGIAAGNTTISYTHTNSCGTARSTMAMTVNPLPVGGTITGTTFACQGATSALHNAATGGVWSSSNSSIATVGSTGIVTGVAAGNATISYTVTNSCGTAVAIATFTVNPLPFAGTITGSNTVCEASTTTLNNTATQGVWSSSNTAAATVGSTGIVTGVAAGTATISYTHTNSCGTARTTALMTVNPLPHAGTISGTATACAGATSSLTTTGTGGAWSSSNTSVATVNSTGVVTAVAAGNATISYTVNNTCGTDMATQVFTVNPLPFAGTITGSNTVCEASTTTLNNTATQGAWSSSNTAVATIGSTGIVTGVAAGTATISYTHTNSCGTARTTALMTVNPLPHAGTISGTATACAGATSSLTTTGTGGAWSSSNTSVATVNSTGVVTAVAAGNATISYTVTNTCGTDMTSTTFTVNPLPNAGTITGSNTVCEASTTTLNNTATGGAWTSSNTSVATVGSTGIVTGVAAGTATISYTHTNSCGTAQTTAAMTVNPLPHAGTISGTTTACAGATSSLTTTGTGGVWSSDNTSAATVNSAGVVTAIAAGSATISYTATNSCGTDMITTAFTVNALPFAGTITGNNTLCEASTTTLNNTATAGAWSSSDAAVATIGSTGIVTGVAAGTATISYTHTNSCGTAYTTAVMTVNPLPHAGTITGTTSVCAGAATTLSSTATGGNWSSSNIAVASIGSTTGIVSGNIAGAITIAYTVSNSCGAALSTTTFTVHPMPAAITGITNTCVGSGNLMRNAVGGGLWTSSNTSIATIESTTGLLSGIAAGTTAITYTTTGGCRAMTTVTVGDIAPISGSSTIAVALTTVFTDAVPGGTWSTSDATVAAIDASGNVTGIAPGTATISYTAASGCVATLDVESAPLYLSGSNQICMGFNPSRHASYPGGVWTSSNTSIATVDPASGEITGVHVGVTRISYTISATQRAYMTVTVNTQPAALTGNANACPGATTSLFTNISGGTWTSSDTTIATVVQGSFGSIVTGVREGSAVITYTLASGCYADTTVVVHALPAAITGNPQICLGSTTVLSDATAGGTWINNNTNISVNPVTGAVRGMGIGTAAVTYTSPVGCKAAMAVTVNALPSTIFGATTVFPGRSVVVHSGTDGGVWCSGDIHIATCSGTSGTATVCGVALGSTTITYTIPTTGCAITTTVAVSMDGGRHGNNAMEQGTQTSVTGVAVYPNPASSPYLTVKAPTGGVLTLYTLDGKQLNEYEITEGSNNITLPNSLPGGIYLSIFKGTDGSTTTDRIVYKP